MMTSARIVTVNAHTMTYGSVPGEVSSGRDEIVTEWIVRAHAASTAMVARRCAAASDSTTRVLHRR